MLNLLAKLKNGRTFRKSRMGPGIVFISLLIGAVLFKFYGAAAYSRFNDNPLNAQFCIIYTVIFALLMFSAFSQLGTLTVIAADTAFEFFILLFSSLNISAFSVKSVALLALQEFLLIAFTVIFSVMSLTVSGELVRRTVNDRRYFASVSASFIVYVIFTAILVFICITAF